MSGVLTVLDLDEVDVTPRFAEVFSRCYLGLVALLVAGGAAEVLPVSLNCPLPLQRIHPPTLVCCFCIFAAMGVTSTKSGRLEVNLTLSEKGGSWEEPFGNYSTFSCFRNLEILHGHPFVAAYIHGYNNA